MPDYRPSLAERLGLDDPARLRALGWALPMSTFLGLLSFAYLLGYGWGVAVVGGVLGFAAGLLVVGGGAIGVTHFLARGGASLLLPSGAGSPGEEEFSRELSLVAAGKVDEALRVLERRREEEPASAALLLLLADTYARSAGKPRRAEPLFRAARKLPGISPERDLYATNRLVDLYLGPLEDRAGAVRELRRILQRHPGSRAAAEVKRLLETL